MKRWIRARLFSVLWDLGDWATRQALALDDSESIKGRPLIDWSCEAEDFDTESAWDPWLIPPSANSTNSTTTKVTWFK